MTESKSFFWKHLLNGNKKFTNLDYFGTAIRVNLNGEHTYKTCFGALLTVGFFLVMVTQIYLGVYQMINRTDPDYSFYKLT